MNKSFFILIISICFSCTKQKPINPETPSLNLAGKEFHHLLFESEAECNQANELSFINCSQFIIFEDSSAGFIVVTDIVNDFNYTVKQDSIFIDVKGDEFTGEIRMKSLNTTPNRLVDEYGATWKEVLEGASIWD